MTFYLNSTVVIKYCLYLTQLKLLLKDYFKFLQWFTEDVMHCGLISCKKITWDILNNWFQNCICILETYCNERKPRADGWSKIFMSCSEKGTFSLSIQSQVEMYTMLTISITGKRWCCYWSLTISHSLFPFLGSPPCPRRLHQRSDSAWSHQLELMPLAVTLTYAVQQLSRCCLKLM